MIRLSILDYFVTFSYYGDSSPHQTDSSYYRISSYYPPGWNQYLEDREEKRRELKALKSLQIFFQCGVVVWIVFGVEKMSVIWEVLGIYIMLRQQGCGFQWSSGNVNILMMKGSSNNGKGF